MLIESSSGAPDSPASRHKAARGDAQRWLAELEREFLQAGESSAQDSQNGDAHPRSSDPAMRGDAPMSALEPADSAATTGHSRDPQGAADPTRATGRPASEPSDTAPSTAAETARTGTPDSNLDATPPDAGDTSPGVFQEDLARPEPIAPMLPAASDAAPGLHAPDGEPCAAPGQRFAPAPRYARQLMSLTDGAHASATIRDASLSAADTQNVAHSVSLQLQAAGFGVQRIFINGQRFDTTPTGSVVRPGRLHPPFQDDNA